MANRYLSLTILPPPVYEQLKHKSSHSTMTFIYKKSRPKSTKQNNFLAVFVPPPSSFLKIYDYFLS